MTTLNIPRSFFHDHSDRDLPTPIVIATGAFGYRINADDPALPELIADAKHYADPHGPGHSPDYVWTRRAAKALLAKLAKQGVSL